MGRSCCPPEGRAGSVGCWAFGVSVLCVQGLAVAAGSEVRKVDQTCEGPELGLVDAAGRSQGPCLLSADDRSPLRTISELTQSYVWVEVERDHVDWRVFALEGPHTALLGLSCGNCVCFSGGRSLPTALRSCWSLLIPSRGPRLWAGSGGPALSNAAGWCRCAETWALLGGGAAAARHTTRPACLRGVASPAAADQTSGGDAAFPFWQVGAEPGPVRRGMCDRVPLSI